MSSDLVARARCARILALALILTTVPAADAKGQLPGVVETVDVRVFSFDVVVTDAAGVPVRGLSREDFELLIAGEPTPIGYFSAIEGGEPVVEGRAEASDALTDSETSNRSRPFLVIVWNGHQLNPGWRKKVLVELGAALPQLISATRGAMVVRQGLNLEIEQVFTDDQRLLESALERAGTARVVTTDAAERAALLRRIENAEGPSRGRLAEENMLRVRAQAEALLHEVRLYQRFERYDLERSLTQLRALIRSLAGMPGRKEILYIGRGFQAQPGAILFQSWWRKYAQIAPAIGVLSMERELGLETVEAKLLAVLEEASARQVTFNTFAPGGRSTLSPRVLFSSMAAGEAVGAEVDRRREFVMTLAHATGGGALAGASSLKPLVDEMVSGFRDFYSLGFQADAPPPGPSRVEVRVRGDYRVRHLHRYQPAGLAPTLEELALSTLVTDFSENPLGIAVDVDPGKRRRGGIRVVPIVVKIPIAALTLVPEGDHHLASVRFVVQAQGATGKLSEPTRGELPLQIGNEELLSAINRSASFRLQLQVAGGEQRIAVAVRDEIGDTVSTLRVIVDSGGQS